MKVPQSSATLWDSMDHIVQGILQPEYWSEKPFPAPGDLPNLGIEPWSSAFQADSLPAEAPEKP